MPETRDFKDVELARTGSFNAITGPVTLTRKDFDDAEASSKELAGRFDPPLKLGHNDKQKLLEEDGLPAAGWLENIRRVGDRLLADFMRVPNAVATAIENGGFRKRSIEAARNGVFVNKKFPFVITGLALLGENLPAVDSLADIEALYAAAEMEEPDDLKGAKSQRIFILAAEEEGDDVNGDPEPEVKKGVIQVELTDLAKKFGLAEDTSEEDIYKFIAELRSRPEAKVDDPEPIPAEADEPAIADPAEVAAMSRQIVSLTEKIALGEATTAVDDAIRAGRFTPASRVQLLKMAVGMPEEFTDLVKNTPENIILLGGEKGVDGDEESLATEFALTAGEMEIADATGVSYNDVVKQKIVNAGHKVPQGMLEVNTEN